MHFINIFIDRVENANIFNIIEGLMLGYHKHLTTTVDDDLIQEFLVEIGNLGYTASKLDTPTSISQIGVLEELKQVSEAFFRQFFPEYIQEQLRNTAQTFLIFHVPPNLCDIPWELFYNTDHFLADRFYIAKSTSRQWFRVNPIRKESLRILIVTDPTEDLVWAREEGEKLSEALYANLSSDRVQIQMLSGKHINKIQLLQALKECDIIHYAGHTYYDSEPSECGWLLSGNKVLRVREIKKAGSMPILVFSNSCLGSSVKGMQRYRKQKSSGTLEYLSDFSSIFTNNGASNYIGTYWELQDNRTACEFALQFYLSIFEEQPLGKALFEARKFARNSYPANNLTWANYTLHGDPTVRIIQPRQKPSFDASRTSNLLWHIRKTYPLPIAQSYLKFLNEHGKNDATENLKLLCRVLQDTLQTLAVIIFANCNHIGVNCKLPNMKSPLSLRKLMAYIYKCKLALHEFKLVLIPARLFNCLHLHRKGLDRLLTWFELFMAGKIKKQSLQAHLVTFQYLLENFLNDLNPLKQCYFIYMQENRETSVLFSGRDIQQLSFTSHISDTLKKYKHIAKFKNQMCLFHSKSNTIISLERYLKYDTKNQKLIFSLSIESEMVSKVIRVPKME